MHLSRKQQVFVDKEYILSFDKTLENGVVITSEVCFLTDKFVDYQKDLLNDFLVDLVESIEQEDIEFSQIKKNFEYGLQDLNSKLNVFAEKIKHIEHFFLKGFVQLVYEENYMASLIGDVSVLIFRNGSVNYSLTNTLDKKSKIDLFADFVEGDLEDSDDIVILGTNIDHVFDEQDLDEVSQVIQSHSHNVLSFLSDVLLTRISQEQLVCIYAQHVVLNRSKKATSSLSDMKKSGFSIDSITSKKLQSLGNTMIQYKYFTIFGIFLVIILILSYNLVSNFVNTEKNNIIVTQSGDVIDINIEDVKLNISAFQKIDASSNDKIIKYKEISDQLNLLQQQGKWLNDVAELKKILQSEYNKGFNIVYVNAIDQLTNKTSSSSDARIYAFNSQDLSALGDIHSLYFEKELFIGGQNGAIVRGVNSDIKGTLVEYGINTPIVGCSMNISKNGLYCYTANGQIYHVMRSGIESVSTKSTQGFSQQIQGIATFGRSNMFVLNNYNNQSGGIITRYQNVIGTQSQFQEGLEYSLTSITGMDFSSGFSSFVVDSTFLVWNKKDRQLYQFWRPGAAPTLNVRTVQIFGGDTMGESYSDSVKIIASLNSDYVYFWDKINQSFTVYSSKGPKTNDANISSYTLNYMFRFKFDLGPQLKVLDIAVSNNSDKPDAYIMTVQGIFKVPLYEYIESIITNNTVRN